MLGRTGRWEATMGEDSNVGLRLDRREARLLLSIPSSSFWLQHLDCPSRNCPDPLHSLGGIISSSAMAKGYVRLSNPHWAIPAFSSRNLNLEYGNRGCNIYPFGGSLKGLPINSAYTDSSGTLIPRPSGPARSDSVNSVSFPISFQWDLLKVGFCCWQPKNSEQKKSSWKMWDTRLAWIAGKDE